MLRKRKTQDPRVSGREYAIKMIKGQIEQLSEALEEALKKKQRVQQSIDYHSEQVARGYYAKTNKNLLDLQLNRRLDVNQTIAEIEARLRGLREELIEKSDQLAEVVAAKVIEEQTAREPKRIQIET